MSQSKPPRVMAVRKSAPSTGSQKADAAATVLQTLLRRRNHQLSTLDDD
eukprot:SAG22_NODE_2291_length_2750_cov_12.539419_2_plen_49_part_00